MKIDIKVFASLGFYAA